MPRLSISQAAGSLHYSTTTKTELMVANGKSLAESFGKGASAAIKWAHYPLKGIVAKNWRGADVYHSTFKNTHPYRLRCVKLDSSPCIHVKNVKIVLRMPTLYSRPYEPSLTSLCVQGILVIFQNFKPSNS
jgi:hypothetical protein